MVAPSLIKRLQSDFTNFMKEGTPGVSAFPNDENFLTWNCTIDGPDVSPYAGQQYSVVLTFPSNYPIVAPVVKFQTPIFHPNIDMSGNVCLDILKENWSAAYSIAALLLSVQSLLETPNNSSPLNNQAAELWDNRTEYLRLVKRRYANLPLN